MTRSKKQTTNPVCAICAKNPSNGNFPICSKCRRLLWIATRMVGARLALMARNGKGDEVERLMKIADGEEPADGLIFKVSQEHGIIPAFEKEKE